MLKIQPGIESKKKCSKCGRALKTKEKLEMRPCVKSKGKCLKCG